MEKAQKIEIAKAAVSLVVSVGVGFVIGNVIKSTTPLDTKKIVKLCIDFSGLVLVGIVSDAATKYTDDIIDETVNTVDEMIKETKRATVVKPKPTEA